MAPTLNGRAPGRAALAIRLRRNALHASVQGNARATPTLSRHAVEIFTRLRHPELQSAQETVGEIEKTIHELGHE